MSIRATARHRAPVRPSTPLTSLTNAVSEHAGTLGRGGVVIAMSSGLVASIGLPADAAGRAAGPEPASPATAPISVSPAVSVQGAFLAAPAPVEASAPVAAPAAATVTFETAAFTAVPKKKVRPAASAAGGSSQSLRQEITGGVGGARGSSVLALAARYEGVPYVYGGSTPSGWDCSGAVRYIYGQLGYDLPRTANDQMLSTRRISRSEARPGDLVFMVSGGRAYHMGIYAGGDMFWDAGRTGRSFTKREMWTSSVVFTRVG